MTKALKRRDTLRQQAANDEEALLDLADSRRSGVKDLLVQIDRAPEETARLPTTTTPGVNGIEIKTKKVADISKHYDSN